MIGFLFELPSWLLLAFCPKIFGGDGDLRTMVLLENECCLSGRYDQSWRGCSTLLSV